MSKRHRSRILSVCIAIFTLAVCGLAWACSHSGVLERNQASLVVYQSSRDLGAIPPEHFQLVPFKISNRGARRLVLNELDHECGCGNRVSRTMVVAPGQTLEIQIPFDARFETGMVETTTEFTTNDPEQPLFDLTVRGQVIETETKSS